MFVARVRFQGWFMHGGVGLQCSSYVCASRVWLSGFKDREGGALSPQNQISDQGWKQGPFIKDTFKPTSCLTGKCISTIISGLGNFQWIKKLVMTRSK